MKTQFAVACVLGLIGVAVHAAEPVAELTESEKMYVEQRLAGVIPAGLDTTALEDGDIGTLNNALGIQISQIVDDDEMFIFSNRLYIQGVDTTNLADGEIVKGFGDTVFCVSGQKPYTTVTGAKRTVRVLVVVNTPAAEAAIADAAYVDWLAEDGSVLVKAAKFVKLEVRKEDGKQVAYVVLQPKPDDKADAGDPQGPTTVDVVLGTLSKAHQKRARDTAKANKKARKAESK